MISQLKLENEPILSKLSGFGVKKKNGTRGEGGFLDYDFPNEYADSRL